MTEDADAEPPSAAVSKKEIGKGQKKEITMKCSASGETPHSMK